MEGLSTPIPHRLFYLRLIVTLGLFVSFLLSLNLWGGERYFPIVPMFEHFLLKPPYDYVLVILSCIFLLCSLAFHRTRLFLFLSILVNVFLVLFDLNRLQPWFYVYNAILMVFLFYNGRVDDPNKFTSVFIFIQVIVASVYIYNGFNQLRNPLFIVSDFYDTILPLKKILSDRQFLLVLKTGKATPYILMFIGFGTMVRPVKYLAISMGLIMHLFLFILLFPSSHNSNFALWFMNLVFGFMILFLFSGKTQQRYFSYSFLFQKPLFYILVTAFWVMPALNSFDRWPGALSFNFKSGTSLNENMPLSEGEYNNLPMYIRGFCTRINEGYVLKVRQWCSHELRSEYFNHDLFVKDGFSHAMQVVTASPPLPEGELSVK